MTIKISVVCLFLIMQTCQPAKYSFFSNILKLKIIEIVNSSINGTQCATDLTMFVKALYKLDWWAVTMFDATGKINSGLLQGNRMLLGNYEQCLSLHKYLPDGAVDAQYCTVPLIVDKNLINFVYHRSHSHQNVSNGRRRTLDLNVVEKYSVFYYGLCIPKSCTSSDLDNIWNYLQKLFRPPFQATFSKELCHYKNQTDNAGVNTYIFFFFVLTLTVELASTAYDLYLRQKGGKPNMFVSLSLYTNTKKLLSMHCDNDSLTCLYGIRAISTIWIIVGHIIVTKVILSTNMMTVSSEWVHKYKNAIFIAAPYNVDTFFAISGLLVVYVYLKLSEKYKINCFLFYLHRVLRLGPPLLATVLFNIGIVKYLADGPLSFTVHKDLQAKCEKSAWYTLLFTSNLVPYRDRCLIHSWYLSVDTQLYLLAPVLLYGIKKNLKMTFVGGLIACTISCIYTWTFVINKSVGFTLFLENRTDDTYANPLCRLPSWLTGTYFGYLLYKHNTKQIHIPKYASILLWFLCLSTFVFLTLYQVSVLEEEYNVYSSAVLNTFSRPLWSLAVCYIIFSCCTGHAETVNGFLSHPVFKVLGKLTYSIYLIHISIIHIVVTNKRQVDYFSTFQVLFNFWGHYASILIGAIMLCLLFETPIVSALKKLGEERSKKVKM